MGEGYVVVTHDRLAEAIEDVARRLKVRARTADEPLNLECSIRFEDVVVADGDLQQQVGVRVTADTEPITGGVLVVVANEVGAGERPSVALGAEPAGDFNFAHIKRRIDHGLCNLRDRVSLEADLTRFVERTDLILLADRDVAVYAGIPELAE